MVLGEVRPPVELALVVGGVGLPGDRGGPAVRQRAAHLLVLRLLRRAVHAVELRSTWEETTAGGGRESPHSSRLAPVLFCSTTLNSLNILHPFSHA